MPSSRGSSQTRDRTHVPYVSCIDRQILYHERYLGSPGTIFTLNSYISYLLLWNYSVGFTRAHLCDCTEMGTSFSMWFFILKEARLSHAGGSITRGQAQTYKLFSSLYFCYVCRCLMGIHIVMPKSAIPWTVAYFCPWNFPGKNMEWVAIPFSRGSSWPRDQTCVSYVSCIKADSLPLSHLGSLLIYPTEALPVAFCPLEKQSKIKRSKIQSFGGAHSSHGSITILNSSPAHNFRTPYPKERSVACWGSNSATPHSTPPAASQSIVLCSFCLYPLIFLFPEEMACICS